MNAIFAQLANMVKTQRKEGTAFNSLVLDVATTGVLENSATFLSFGNGQYRKSLTVVVCSGLMNSAFANGMSLWRLWKTKWRHSSVMTSMSRSTNHRCLGCLIICQRDRLSSKAILFRIFRTRAARKLRSHTTESVRLSFYRLLCGIARSKMGYQCWRKFISIIFRVTSSTTLCIFKSASPICWHT